MGVEKDADVGAQHAAPSFQPQMYPLTSAVTTRAQHAAPLQNLPLLFRHAPLGAG
jgi:hypothetical protein